MRNLFLLVLLCFFLSSYSQNSFIGVRGKEIIDANGQPMLIKGTNLGNWLLPEGYMFKFEKVNAPWMIEQVLLELIGPSANTNFWKSYLDNYITETDIRLLKEMGSNSVRLPFDYRLFTNESYLGVNDSTRGFYYMDKVVSWCKKYKLYLLLDMHGAPGGQTGDNIDNSYGYPFLYTDSGCQQKTIDIWKRIATRYRNESIILGYDLLNEPIAHFFEQDKLNPLLEPLYKRIVKAIRQVDKNHLVFLEGAQWASKFSMFSKPFDTKLVYSFHKYWTDTTQDVIQEYVDFRERYQVPIYVGETGENDDRWILSFRKLLQKNNIGWHYWPYKKMESTSCVVSFPKPGTWDTLVTYTKALRISHEDIRKARPQNMASIHDALETFLQNMHHNRYTFNTAYIEGIGMKRQKKEK
ncbi:MAG: glycoside hydrolase family 5 protein [Bacteroidota bacterium]